jgi:hypothetical protein
MNKTKDEGGRGVCASRSKQTYPRLVFRNVVYQPARFVSPKYTELPQILTESPVDIKIDFQYSLTGSREKPVSCKRKRQHTTHQHGLAPPVRGTLAQRALLCTTE